MTQKPISTDPRFVGAGLLLSFSSSAANIQDDILSSTLLGQLAADKHNSRFTAPVSWYDAYTNTLGNLAWQISEFQNQQYIPAGKTITLEQIIRDVLKGITTASGIDLVQGSIDLFSKLPKTDQRVLIYEKFSRSSRIIDLQVGVVNASSKLSAVGVVLETKQEVKDLFKEEIPVSQLVGKIRTLLYEGTLNETVYASLRDQVIAKLGSKRDELILNLDLLGSQNPLGR